MCQAQEPGRKDGGGSLQGLIQRAVETALCGWEELPDDWITTATVNMKTGREVFSMSSEKRTDE